MILEPLMSQSESLMTTGVTVFSILANKVINRITNKHGYKQSYKIHRSPKSITKVITKKFLTL